MTERSVPQEVVRLQPIAMVIPTRECVYAPSRLSPVQEMPYAEFLEKFADRPRPIEVSFDADGKSNPVEVTAYGPGMDCWYILAGELTTQGLCDTIVTKIRISVTY